MNDREMTLNEVRSRGFAALVRELGPVGYVRFIQQFEAGAGDFTKERRQWADALTAEDLQKMLREARARLESTGSQ